ncbi:MAG: AI-2E family transporter [Verrucomicrobiota bacterium]
MRSLHPYKNKFTQAGGSSGSSSLLARVVLFILVAVALFGVLRMISPFMPPIILALFLVTIFYPLYRRLRRLTAGRENLAAGFAVITVFVVVVIPLAAITAAIVHQGMGFFQELQQSLQEGDLQELFQAETIEEFSERPVVATTREFMIEHFFQGEEERLDPGQWLLTASQEALQLLGRHIVPIMTKTGFLILNFFIMLFIMFYAFRDGEKMLQYLWDTLPMSTTNKRLVADRIRNVSRALLLGILMTAAIQALVAMVAFRIVGIPFLLWGVMLGVAALVPIIGTGLVWVPATAYLFLNGDIGEGIFLLLWCGILVASIDNFLRPVLMKGEAGMSTLILFFALLGGIRLFGPIGILYGPLIFAFCAVILYIYRVENRQILEQLKKR